MYIIGTLSPLNDIDFIKNAVTFELPKDYFDFLKKYGYGNICEAIYFYKPDEQHIKNTFMEYIDELWDWQNEKQKNIVLNGLSIGGTIDEDIICCVNVVYLLMFFSQDIQRLFYHLRILNYYSLIVLIIMDLRNYILILNLNP